MIYMFRGYQNHMGWDNEEAIVILLDYIDNIHLDYDIQRGDVEHLQEYLDHAVREGSPQRRDRLSPLHPRFVYAENGLTDKKVTGIMKELEDVLIVAQQEGLGTLNNKNAEISLEVSLNHTMRNLTEAMAQYSVARCHGL
jgi:hypothetical protein